MKLSLNGVGDPDNRKRAKNFTIAEMEVLVSEVEKRKNILPAAFTSNITNNSKQDQWKVVSEAVNKVSNHARTPQEILKKWTNYKSNTKGNFSGKMTKSFVSKTGGGEAREPLLSYEVRIIGILGSTSVTGIDGGHDTSFSFVFSPPATPVESGIDKADEDDDFQTLRLAITPFQMSGTPEVEPDAVIETPNALNQNGTPINNSERIRETNYSKLVKLQTQILAAGLKSSDNSSLLVKIEEEKLKVLRQLLEFKDKKWEDKKHLKLIANIDL